MISACANSTAGVFPPGPTPCPTTSEPKSACRRAPSRTNPGSGARAGGTIEVFDPPKKKRQAGPPSGAAPPGCPYPGIPGGGPHLHEWRFDRRALGCGSPEINADQAGGGRLKVAKQLHFATLSRSVIPYPLFSGVWRAGGWGAGSKHGERYIRQLRGVLRRHGHPLRTRGSRPPHTGGYGTRRCRWDTGALCRVASYLCRVGQPLAAPTSMRAMLDGRYNRS